MNLQLNKKTALVTGSTSGIGLAIAAQLCAEGAHVYINGRSQKRVDETIRKIEESVPNGKLSGIVADFSSADGAEAVTNKLSAVDILVNNVGIFEPKSFGDIPDEDWYKLFEVNVMSGVRLSRFYFPKMKTNNWGRIVFVSSESGSQIPEEMIHYGMTKAAQIAIANGLARATKGTGVTVNSILPGPTWSGGAELFITELANAGNQTTDEFSKQFFKHGRPSSLLQRFATTNEVANMVTYICSPLSSATNGAALRVDGGSLPTMF